MKIVSGVLNMELHTLLASLLSWTFYSDGNVRCLAQLFFGEYEI